MRRGFRAHIEKLVIVHNEVVIDNATYRGYFQTAGYEVSASLKGIAFQDVLSTRKCYEYYNRSLEREREREREREILRLTV